MLDLFNLPGEKWQLLVAGALGGLVRWITLRDNWKDGLASVLVGTICALYPSPLTLPMLSPLLANVGIQPESTNGLSGFLTGIAGIAMSGLIIDFLKIRAKVLKGKAKE
jgi:hypothetical protein